MTNFESIQAIFFLEFWVKYLHISPIWLALDYILEAPDEFVLSTKDENLTILEGLKSLLYETIFNLRVDDFNA